MTDRLLRTCPQCGRHFSVTLWQMHAHNPEQVQCSDAGCGDHAMGYCADAPLQQGVLPLCGVHLVEHRRHGHEVRFVDGGVCTVCDGRGRIRYASTPGGRRIRCPACQGTGYVSEHALHAQRRRTAEREAHRPEGEAQEGENHEGAQWSASEVSPAMEAEGQASNARADQAQPMSEKEEPQRRAEEGLGEERAEARLSNRGPCGRRKRVALLRRRWLRAQIRGVRPLREVVREAKHVLVSCNRSSVVIVTGIWNPLRLSVWVKNC